MITLPVLGGDLIPRLEHRGWIQPILLQDHQFSHPCGKIMCLADGTASTELCILESNALSTITHQPPDRNGQHGMIQLGRHHLQIDALLLRHTCNVHDGASPRRSLHVLHPALPARSFYRGVDNDERVTSQARGLQGRMNERTHQQRSDEPMRPTYNYCP